MNKKLLYVLGTTLLVGFAGYSYSKFADALTPYVSFDQARDTQRTVQVAGGLVQGSSSYDNNGGFLRFHLVDPENDRLTMPVRYSGLRPANFEDAISIVAIGNFDANSEEFAAHNLLVKCPSKYQGVEGYEEKSYGDESREDRIYDSPPLTQPVEPATGTATS